MATSRWAQGCSLRFDFVARRPITVGFLTRPVECRQRPSPAPLLQEALYPRFRPMSTWPTTFHRYLHTGSLTVLTAPYSQIRKRPSWSAQWIPCPPSQASTTYSSITSPRPLKTMADPVARTASPYFDPSVKGPRSQQLSQGLAHSLLQDRKSELSRIFTTLRHLASLSTVFRTTRLSSSRPQES